MAQRKFRSITYDDVIIKQELNRAKQQIINNEIRESFKDITEQVDKLNDKLSDGASLITSLPYNLNFFDVFNTILNSLPFATTVTLIFRCLLKAVEALAFSKSIVPTRAIKATVALGGLALGIAALVITSLSLPLLIASIAIELIQKLWKLGTFLSKHYFSNVNKNPSADIKRFKQEQNKLCKELISPTLAAGRQKLLETQILTLENKITEKTNAQFEFKAKLAEKIHDIGTDTISLIGSILLCTPLSLVGGFILVGISTYTLLNRFDINPFKRLALKIFGNPFAPKEPRTLEQIQKDLFLQSKKLSTLKTPGKTPSSNILDIQTPSAKSTSPITFKPRIDGLFTNKRRENILGVPTSITSSVQKQGALSV